MTHAVRLIAPILVSCPLLLTTSCSVRTPVPDDGFVMIFDGKTLNGWRVGGGGTAKDWSVGKNGVLVGKCKSQSSYLVFADNALRDFELKLSYRLLTKANTGVEIRGRVDPTGKRPFESYHADIGHIGIGKNVLGAWDFHFSTRREHPNPRGSSLVIDAEENPHLTDLPDALTVDDIYSRAQWNHVRIVARGNHCQFFINNKLSSEFIDKAASGRLESGFVALQLHDEGIHVEFKDLRLKRL